MKSFEEILKELQELKLIQKSYEWLEDLPDKIYSEYFDSRDPIDIDLDIDKHRWYETSIEVYNFNDRYLGVRSVTQGYSEMSSCEDFYHTIEFFEMKEIKTVTYEKK